MRGKHFWEQALVNNDFGFCEGEGVALDGL
jgi:hypothetical protein